MILNYNIKDLPRYLVFWFFCFFCFFFLMRLDSFYPLRLLIMFFFPVFQSLLWSGMALEGQQLPTSIAFLLLKDCHCLVSSLIPASRYFKILDSICYQWERWSELPSLLLSKADVSVISIVLLLNPQLQHVGSTFLTRRQTCVPALGAQNLIP